MVDRALLLLPPLLNWIKFGYVFFDSLLSLRTTVEGGLILLEIEIFIAFEE